MLILSYLNSAQIEDPYCSKFITYNNSLFVNKMNNINEKNDKIIFVVIFPFTNKR